LGLLTIDESDLGGVVLRVPNNVIKELYFEFFAKNTYFRALIKGRN